MKAVTAGAIVLAATLSTVGVVAAVTTYGSSAQPGDPLVYVCPLTQGTTGQNCANDQEFEVFDTYGAPIFSVGEFGGAGVFGDNLSVVPPGTVTHAAVTESYTTPAGYGSTSCVAPAIWLAPQGLWKCTSSGTWSRRSSFIKPAHHR